MNITEFILRYKNHPVLFIGTGFSLRYLENSFTWDALLAKIAFDLKGSEEYYFDIKALCQKEGRYKYDIIASELEKEFNNYVSSDRNGKFKEINDIFYENMKNAINISRFKIYVGKIFESLSYKKEKTEELVELKKIRKNVGSIITTNYDRLIEDTFEFNRLVGNDILLSNPYGSVYKIHGCVTDVSKLIITQEDYHLFSEKYELIRAQLLSLFIHNPIIFIGYSIGDDNIKDILKTIFTYVEPNSEQAKKIRDNFLLIEYEPGNLNEDIAEHDIELQGFSTIRINKIRTDNFTAIYKAIAGLQLPISALDIRKVQTIVKEIYSGGNIKVKITEDFDDLQNSEKILAIGTDKTIQYQYSTISETIQSYFNIIDEAHIQRIALIDKYNIAKTQYFPIYAFSTINTHLETAEQLKQMQKTNLLSYFKSIKGASRCKSSKVGDILSDSTISSSAKSNAIFYSTMSDTIDLDDLEKYLRTYHDKKSTDYRKMLCAYDYKRYNK